MPKKPSAAMGNGRSEPINSKAKTGESAPRKAEVYPETYIGPPLKSGQINATRRNPRYPVVLNPPERKRNQTAIHAAS